MRSSNRRGLQLGIGRAFECIDGNNYKDRFIGFNLLDTVDTSFLCYNLYDILHAAMIIWD